MIQSSSNNLEKSTLPFENTEHQSIELRKIRTKVAAAMFALIMQTNPVFSGEKINVATNGNGTPSASVPTAEKGGGQVVEIDGIPYTFAQISKLSSEKQVELLMKTSEKNQNAFGEYLEKSLLVGKERVEMKKGVEQAVNQRVEMKKGVEQAVNQELLKKQIESIELMQKLLKNGKKLTKDDKQYLEWIVNKGKPPVDKLAKEILENPQNFA